MWVAEELELELEMMVVAMAHEGVVLVVMIVEVVVVEIEMGVGMVVAVMMDPLRLLHGVLGQFLVKACHPKTMVSCRPPGVEPPSFQF